ncbi:multicopper oxidase family protein [Aliifodinibius sp. S!AR15-10]|uniref:multicopper oxidase family protein n=1 Tax=Aliifodinibius sp. S!AR15-10 TaxID=2950437 RepID=UPI002866255D|nr:multicopper oxidase family protein [Aliifodinibius sp. S!AR15-10]MDR8391437.1 multicopper oxidase family protein [Aliifodinibius sp. S!AR15-10]
MNRKTFLKYTGAGAGFLLAPSVITSCMNAGSNDSDVYGFPLQFPDTLNSDQLQASRSNLTIAEQYTLDGLQFNGSLPGPIVRIKRGERFHVQFQNDIGQESIIHWHGMIVPPDMDGHPKDVISEGSYPYEFTINQRAGTYWYHPHPHKITGPQVYRGLAGFFIVTDDEEQALNLPSGDYELPLVIQDRKIDDSGNIYYNPSTPERMMTGYLGGHILVNGIPNPYHEVQPRPYRLRLLNGSNARIYNIAFRNGNSFTVIGSDGGLLPQPVESNELLLAPGERADILVDFSNGFSNNSAELISKEFSVPSNGGMMGNMSQLMGQSGPEQGSEFPLMEFRIGNEADSSAPIDLPRQLSDINFPNEEDAERTRSIELNMEMMRGHTINGRQFEMLRVDEEVSQGDTEIWEFINNSAVPHPMHIHVVQFKVLSRSGSRGLLPTETGWKDTVLVMPGERVRVIMTFDAPKGLYVFHCHNLEHEDAGMMANLKIV